MGSRRNGPSSTSPSPSPGRGLPGRSTQALPRLPPPGGNLAQCPGPACRPGLLWLAPRPPLLAISIDHPPPEVFPPGTLRPLVLSSATDERQSVLKPRPLSLRQPVRWPDRSSGPLRLRAARSRRRSGNGPIVWRQPTVDRRLSCSIKPCCLSSSAVSGARFGLQPPLFRTRWGSARRPGGFRSELEASHRRVGTQHGFGLLRHALRGGIGPAMQAITSHGSPAPSFAPF